VDTLSVTGTIDELALLETELTSLGAVEISVPRRIKGGLLAREGDAQLELLSVSIAVAEGVFSAALYDVTKALIVTLRKRGHRSLRIEDEPADDSDEDDLE
jgi:hypothetical protein